MRSAIRFRAVGSSDAVSMFNVICAIDELGAFHWWSCWLFNHCASNMAKSGLSVDICWQFLGVMSFESIRPFGLV